MKLCFSTLGCAERNLSEILSLSEKFNLPYLEIRGIGGVLDNAVIEDFCEENATKTKEIMMKSGVTPVVLGTSCMLHTEDSAALALIEARAAISVAARLSIPYIRVFGNNLIGRREDCIRRVTEGIAALCDMAKGTDVSVLLEVHGDFNTVQTLSPVLDALKMRNEFGLIWDVAHSHTAYGEKWETFYECIRPYIRHVHIKDKRTEGGLTMIGEGDVPVAAIVRRMLKDGYDGCFSLEWERLWHPELAEIEVALARFTSYFNALS